MHGGASQRAAGGTKKAPGETPGGLCVSGEAVGETQPLVPTADGVREEGNRAVVINLN